MESLPFNLRRRVNLSSMEKTLEAILQFGNYVNTAYDAEQFTVEVVGSLRDNLIIPDNWDDWDDSNMDFLFEYLYNIWEEYLKEYYNDVKGDDSISEEVSRIKEVMGIVTETRQGMFNWFKEKLPNTPEYVIRDWVYKIIKNDGGLPWTKKGITEWIDEWIKDVEWEFQKDFPISMDIFTDKTKKELESRIGGEVRQDVDKDTERHETQKELLQSKGISEEPIILFKTRDGKYELGEGWHRTTQTFIQFPEGFIQPNVYIGLNAKWLD
jgi:hypothetical protein